MLAIIITVKLLLIRHKLYLADQHQYTNHWLELYSNFRLEVKSRCKLPDMKLNLLESICHKKTPKKSVCHEINLYLILTSVQNWCGWMQLIFMASACMEIICTCITLSISKVPWYKFGNTKNISQKSSNNKIITYQNYIEPMHKTVVLKVNAKCLVHLHPGIYVQKDFLCWNTTSWCPHHTANSI